LSDFAGLCGILTYIRSQPRLNMLKRERQAYILHQLNLHNKVLSSSLCSEIQVSEDTIRRDLQELAGEGKIIKVHGGALSQSFSQFHFPSSNFYSPSGKNIIANKAVRLIKDGMCVLTGGGTTIIEMARCLPAQMRATFITGSIPAVVEYLNHPNIEVIIIGDKISRNSKITVGTESINRIKQLKPDLCFLGINAIDVQHGITDNDWDIVQVKKAMIESAQKTICLTIAEKINTFQPLLVCGINKIDVLITELEPSDPLLMPFVELGITVM
jgi:DeoR/GlpR family transcriptional regulator of sugar metabolism